MDTTLNTKNVYSSAKLTNESPKVYIDQMLLFFIFFFQKSKHESNLQREENPTLWQSQAGLWQRKRVLQYRI